MFRALGALCFAILFLIFSTPLMGVEWLYRKINKKKADLSSLRIVQWAFKVIIQICGTEVEVIGQENIPENQPVLYVGNHRSYFDVIIAYSLCESRTGFIAKDALEKIPLLRIWMRRLYCLFLDRENPRDGLRVILAAVDHIKHGVSVFVFPEGTRAKTDDMGTFKEGTFKIATKTDCLIVPVAFTNTDDILERHMPFVRKTRVILHYGRPIDPKELDPEQKKHIGAYAQKVIADMLSADKERL